MRIPTPEPQLTTELSPFFVFPDGNATADIDGFLAAAARNWDFSCTALADGRFANFLFKLHADEVANLARSLAANNDLSPDRRLRMFLEYSQPDPDAPAVDPVEEYETIIGVQYALPDEPVADISETKVSARQQEEFAASIGDARVLATTASAAQSATISQGDGITDVLPPQGTSTVTLDNKSAATAEPRTVATVTPVISDGVRQSTRTGAPVSTRGSASRSADGLPTTWPSDALYQPQAQREVPRYRAAAEPIIMRWWYWPLMLVTALPVMLGALTYTVGTAVPTNVMMALLAVTGILASLQMVITSGVRMPAWATFMLVFPMAIGVMGGGALAAALVGPAASMQNFLEALLPGIVPLALLVAAGVSIRRTWRLWVAVHILLSLVSSADIVNAFILAK
jgi:hypothetical protein